MIDSAKAAKASATAAAAASAAAAAGLLPSSSSPEPAASQPPPPVTRVYGPPGLGELLRVSLSITGEEPRLQTHISVTELVLDPASAHPRVALTKVQPAAVFAEPERLKFSGDPRRGSPANPRGGEPSGDEEAAPRGPGGSAVWHSEQTTASTASAATSPSPSGPPGSSSGAGGGSSEQAAGSCLTLERLAARSVFSDPDLSVRRALLRL
jgi:hypothetical protein